MSDSKNLKRSVYRGEIRIFFKKKRKSVKINTKLLKYLLRSIFEISNVTLLNASCSKEVSLGDR